MGKRAYDLYPRLYAFDNLVAAERAAARGKRGRPDVARFEYQLEDELVWLRDALRDETYRPGPYRLYTIRAPKERVIAAAPYRDRVVHHALCRVIEPYFERRFIGDSYASRHGKGTHAALDRCTQFARRFPYVLRCDIVQFFPSVDHAVLRRQLGRVIGDPRVLRLCDMILAGGAEITPPALLPAREGGPTPLAVMNDQRTDGGINAPVAAHNPTRTPALQGRDCSQPRVVGASGGRPHGLPIGNQTSQFWANVYLDALDQFVKRQLRCVGYVRYVDDFLLFAAEKRTLHAWKEAIIAFLDDVRLSLHEAESTVVPVATGIPFLGFRVYPDHRRLRRRNALAFARRFRALTTAYTAGTVSFARMTASVHGWVAHVAHGDTYHLRQTLLSRRIAPPTLPASTDLEEIHAWR